jgi:hypothetical protein
MLLSQYVDWHQVLHFGHDHLCISCQQQISNTVQTPAALISPSLLRHKRECAGWLLECNCTDVKWGIRIDRLFVGPGWGRLMHIMFAFCGSQRVMRMGTRLADWLAWLIYWWCGDLEDMSESNVNMMRLWSRVVGGLIIHCLPWVNYWSSRQFLDMVDCLVRVVLIRMRLPLESRVVLMKMIYMAWFGERSTT